jgi:hypothetical protein
MWLMHITEPFKLRHRIPESCRRNAESSMPCKPERGYRFTTLDVAEDDGS